MIPASTLWDSAWRGLLPAAAIVLLAGCAAVPNLPPPAVMKAPQDLAAQQSFAGKPGAFPQEQWWSAFGDPALDALMAEALAASPDIAEAAARARAAGALQDQARSALLPTLTIEGDVGGDRQSQNRGFPPGLIPGDLRSQGRIVADANWDLDLWGRNRSALAAATSDRLAAEVDAAQARLLLTTALAQAYSDLADQFAVRDLAAQDLALAEAGAALAQARVSRGLDNAGALSRAQEQAAQARGALSAADQAIALTRNALAVLLGAGPDRGLAIGRPRLLAGGALALPADLPFDLIGRRPDIVSARLRAEAASARIGVARADFYPSFNLAAIVGLQSIGLDMLLRQSSLTASFGPAVRLPIFDGGQAAARFKGARADYDLAVARYDAALVGAFGETADAIARKRALGQGLVAARTRADAAERSRSVLASRYAAGLENRMALLAAERAQIEAQRALAALQAQDRAADIALIRALGGGFRAAPTGQVE